MLYHSIDGFSMLKRSKDGSSNPQKFMISVSDDMLSALKEEQKRRKALNIQDVIRQILGEYFTRLLIPKQEGQ